MDSLLRKVVTRYGLFISLFGAFIIFVLLQTSDDELYVNLLITMMLLAIVPLLMAFVMWTKKRR